MDKNDEFVIGVPGGMGTYATIHLFKEYASIFPATKEWERPRIIIDNRCTMLSRVRAFLYGENVSILVDEMVDSLQQLINAGCKRIILDCNTSHLFLPQIYERLPVLSEGYIVDIIKVCAEEVAKNTVNKPVYLLGTEGTIESGIYQSALTKRNIKCLAPTKEEYHKLRNCIEAVKQDKYSDQIKEIFCELVNRYDICILGCTELPILYSKYNDGVKAKKIYDPINIALNRIYDEYTQTLAK